MNARFELSKDSISLSPSVAWNWKKKCLRFVLPDLFKKVNYQQKVNKLDQNSLASVELVKAMPCADFQAVKN